MNSCFTVSYGCNLGSLQHYFCAAGLLVSSLYLYSVSQVVCGAIECASTEGQVQKIVSLPKCSCKETSRSQAPPWLVQRCIQLLRRRILVLMLQLGRHLFCTATALSKGRKKHCLPTLNEAFVLTICGHNLFHLHSSNQDIYIDPGNQLEILCTCFFIDVYRKLWNNCLRFSILWEHMYAIKSRLYRSILLISP